MWENIKIYVELAKLRIVFMVLVTTTIGFFLGGEGIHSISLLFFTLLGTGYAAAGSAALNNVIERDLDKDMNRTKGRALPEGRVAPASALAFGVCSTLLGVCILLLKVNLLTAFTVLLTAFLYVVVYTPLKRVSWLNTSVGAIPGALPPMTGWAAATGQLDQGAWILFAILFAWQHPHFFAIAWMYKDDYGRANYKMLPVVEPDGRRTFKYSIVFAVVLLAISILPTTIGLTGNAYLIGALLLGLALLAKSYSFAREKSIASARSLLRATVLYLPILLFLIIFDVSV